MRVGVNGFGRIGRVVSRILARTDGVDLVAVNDIAQDVGNLSYLYNYDSTYGAPAFPAKMNAAGTGFSIRGQEIAVSCAHDIAAVKWADHGVDMVIDASGVAHNVENAHKVVAEQGIDKVIVTHSPKSNIDAYSIYGLNHDAISPDHAVISSSICDANAIAHPLNILEKEYGIESGFITTLHPWLSYQNLVDSPVASQSNPGHFWTDYALGRSSSDSLIPKDTTAVKALDVIIPDISKKLDAISYRTPTAIVSSADMTLQLKTDVTAEQVRALMHHAFDACDYVALNSESLVSVDYIRNTHSAIIDLQWVKTQGRLLKMVVWYDNEWGYCSRVVDLVQYLGTQKSSGVVKNVA